MRRSRRRPSRRRIPIVLASVSSSITDWITESGIYAVFLLMAVDAVFPVGGELIMVFAGVLAAGAVAGQHTSLLGAGIATGFRSYVAFALAGTLGYLVGALFGWAIGVSGGRAMLDRHGRRLHVGPDSLARAEGWFERYGLWAVFLGRITPVVRSFISIPAGVFRTPLAPYTLLTLLGSAVWCFGFAGVGWALGGSWESFNKSFNYVDALSVVAAVVLAGLVVIRRVRRRRALTERPPGSSYQDGEELRD